MSESSIRRDVLANGVRFVTERMAHVRSVSIGIWLTRGSRHEPFDHAGIAHFADAAQTYERVGAPAHLGRAQVAWAKALLARRSPGDAEQARTLLTEAVTAAREQGFVSVQRRAAPLLAGS